MNVRYAAYRSPAPKARTAYKAVPRRALHYFNSIESPAALAPYLFPSRVESMNIVRPKRSIASVEAVGA